MLLLKVTQIMRLRLTLVLMVRITMDGLAFNLADKDAKHPSHINVFLGDYGSWELFYQGGLHEGKLDGGTQPSHVHRTCWFQES